MKIIYENKLVLFWQPRQENKLNIFSIQHFSLGINFSDINVVSNKYETY